MRPLIAGNWKMNGLLADGLALVRDLKARVAAQGTGAFDLLVCPPATLLQPLHQELQGSGIALGAQDCHALTSGAHTGEISAAMLADLGVGYVILGHSERRHILGEEDGFIRDKVASTLEAGLIPVLCCGEKLEEREAGQTMEVIEAQLEQGLRDIPISAPDRLVVAYEPVWAIGTGRTATPGIAQEVHKKIRDWLAGRYHKDLAMGLRILYGGSVKGSNVKALMAEADIDGALVGGASLSGEAFLPIVRYRL